MPSNKWTIKPLGGKYYGTEIQAPNGNVFRIWGAGDNTFPSDRELDRLGPDATAEEIADLRSDNHSETQGDYEVAQTIIEALNAKAH